MADLVTGLVDLARDYVRSEITVTLESNILPPVTIYRGGMAKGGGVGGAGLADALGVRGGVVVRNAQGQKLASFGDPAPLDYARALLVGAVLAGGVYLLLRSLR